MRSFFALALLCCTALPALAEDGDLPAFAAPGADGWVRLEPGARPAYVGIQGGTAPISLLRADDGSLYAFTGNTGNDFMQVLGKDAGSNGTALNADAAPGAAVLAEGALAPFGLNNPEGVSAAVAVSQIAAAPENDQAPDFKPLKLGSYRSVLNYYGNL